MKSGRRRPGTQGRSRVSRLSLNIVLAVTGSRAALCPASRLRDSDCCSALSTHVPTDAFILLRINLYQVTIPTDKHRTILRVHELAICGICWCRGRNTFCQGAGEIGAGSSEPATVELPPGCDDVRPRRF